MDNIKENLPLVYVIISGLKVILPYILPVVLGLILLVLIYSLVKYKLQASTIIPGNNLGFWGCFAKNIFTLCRYIPKLLIICGICFVLNIFLMGIFKVTKVFSDFKKIQELNLTVRNLSKSEAFAQVTLLEESQKQDGTALKTYKVDILGSDFFHIISSQTFKLEGQEIVIDSININFDYSVISQGEKFNLAYPYRVYSELIPSSQALPLTCMYNNEDIPVIFCLENKDIFGLEDEAFYKNLNQIFSVIKNEDLSRKMGIRSTIGNAVHFNMSPGQIMDLYIEGTGGISVKKHERLF